MSSRVFTVQEITLFDSLIDKGSLALEWDTALCVMESKSINELCDDLIDYYRNSCQKEPFNSYCKYSDLSKSIYNPDYLPGNHSEYEEAITVQYRHKNDIAHDFYVEVHIATKAITICRPVDTYMAGIFIKDSSHYPRELRFPDRFKIEFSEELLKLDDELYARGESLFNFRIRDLEKDFFNIENAIKISLEHIRSLDRYSASVEDLESVLRYKFSSELNLAKKGGMSLRELCSVKFEEVGVESVNDYLVSILKDDRVDGDHKTKENLKEIIYNIVDSKLESVPLSEIEASSFSTITGIHQPGDTCPYIDDEAGNIDYSEFEAVIDKIQREMDDVNENIRLLTRQLRDLDEKNDEEEQYRSERLRDLINDDENLMMKLQERLDCANDDLGSFKDDIEDEYEGLRGACSDSRHDILRYRESLYDYFKSFVFSFEDCGEDAMAKNYYSFNHDKSSCERGPRRWYPTEGFNRRLLEDYGFKESLANYDAIIEWGESLTNIVEYNLDELFPSVLSFDALLDRIIDEAVSEAEKIKEKKGRMAS